MPRLEPTLAFRLGLLALLAGLVYAGGLTAPYLHDDEITIVFNPVVSDLGLLFDTARLDEVIKFTDLRNIIRTRGFTFLTFALGHGVHGMDPVGFRLVNIAIHAANACLVYLLATQLLARCQPEDAAPSPPAPRPDAWLPLVVALLFVAHPINTSAVAYLTQRFTTLVSFLSLLALFAYLRGRSAASPWATARWLTVGFGATALAMWTKEDAFTLPVTLTLVESIFFSAPWRRRVLLLAPFYATMAIIPAALWSAVPSASGLAARVAQGTDLMNLEHLPRLAYLFTQFTVILTYLRLLLVPVGLSFDHDHPVYRSLLDPPVAASLASLLLLLALGLLLLARSRPLGGAVRANHRVGAFGVLFFFVTLSMSSSLIPINDVINEYRVYLPSVGIYLLLATGADTALRSLPALRGPGARRAAALACAVVIGLLGGATVARNLIWRDRLTFWQDTWAGSPAKVRVAQALADEYQVRGRPEAAVETLQTLADLNPRLAKPQVLLGQVYLSMGRTDDALAALRRALALRSDVPEVHVWLALAFFAQERPDLAAGAIAEIERIDPRNPMLGSLLARLRPRAEAAP